MTVLEKGERQSSLRLRNCGLDLGPSSEGGREKLRGREILPEGGVGDLCPSPAELHEGTVTSASHRN